jgi:(p)ppGpp synthase/HD superfamily hydrolase
MNSTLTPTLRRALALAIRVHETDEHQKRKGKDVPYIVHPLTVALVLARAGASDDVIAAGLLHDTIEDSVPAHMVTRADLAEQFGEAVADMVEVCTEQDKAVPWTERKAEALHHIGTMLAGALAVKSADVICNNYETVSDYARSGEAIFARFSNPKGAFLANQRAVLAALIKRWEEIDPTQPMLTDLNALAGELAAIG